MSCDVGEVTERLENELCLNLAAKILHVGIFLRSLSQEFSNCGTRTTCGTWKVVRWYAIKFTKILNLKIRRNNTSY